MQNRRHSLIAILAVIILVVVAVVAFSQRGAGATTNSDEPCVPSDAWTEVIEHPAVTHEETVVVSPAVPGQHYSLKGNSGIEKDEVPPTPDVNPDIWQANTAQEPHDNGAGSPVTWLGEAGSGLHYASHGSEGKRDWFFYQAPKAEVTKVIVVVDEEAWTETIEHPAVVCDTPTETPTTPTETPTTPTETPTTPTETPTTPTETPTVPTEVPTVVPTPEPEDDEPLVICGITIPEAQEGEPVNRDVLCPPPADKDKKDQKTDDQPAKDKPATTPTMLVECVDGAWVTTVDGEVVGTSGSCDEASATSRTAVSAQEEGL